MKNKDVLIKYLRIKLEGKPKILIRNYILLGYDEIEAFKKTMEYLKTKRRYTMYRKMQKILIDLKYYKRCTFEDIFNKINKKDDREFIKQRFITYVNCCDFDEWLESEMEDN